MLAPHRGASWPGVPAAPGWGSQGRSQMDAGQHPLPIRPALALPPLHLAEQEPVGQRADSTAAPGPWRPALASCPGPSSVSPCRAACEAPPQLTASAPPVPAARAVAERAGLPDGNPRTEQGPRARGQVPHWRDGHDQLHPTGAPAGLLARPGAKGAPYLRLHRHLGEVLE